MFRGEQSNLPVASHGFQNEGNNQKPKRDILNQATSKSDNKGLGKERSNCIKCESTFESVLEMKNHMIQEHIMKKPKQYEVVQGDGLCDLCGSEFYSKDALQWHQKKCNKRKEEFTNNVIRTPGTELKKEDTHINQCELCDEVFISNSKLSSIQLVREHKDVAHPVDMTQYRQKLNCDDCDFGADSGKLLKKHERDCHNTWDCSKSISPPPKRKRKPNDFEVKENKHEGDQIQNSKDIDMVNEAVKQMEHMELDEKDELKKRSDQQDKKITDKRKREEIKDEEQRQVKIDNDNKKQHKENKETTDSHKKKSEGKSDEKRKNQNFKEQVKMKEGVSIIEEKYWDLVGENRFKIDVKSDGTCQAGAKVAALIGITDQETKLELAKAENKYLLDN